MKAIGKALKFDEPALDAMESGDLYRLLSEKVGHQAA